MDTRIDFYQRLREHLPEPAARIIAEQMPIESQLATKQDLEMVEVRLEASIERLRSGMFRWQLMFFVPLWIGVYGTLIAIVFRGVP